MRYVRYQPNPANKRVSDCVIRALTKSLESEGYDWDRTFCELCALAFAEKDMPSSNAVWAKFLINKGFEYHDIMMRCLDCYTIKDFADEHQNDDNIYLIGTGDHVVACSKGTIYDIFNSSDMIPTYYFSKEINNKEKEKEKEKSSNE